ncbi:MAG: NADP-dependent oxidoreductase [Leptospirales bacterium]|nr:NADP-dependent oxidoreductase [Leptospirales bacterium]
MKAAVLARYGDQHLQLRDDFPEPVPGPGDLLVRMRAASLNPIDWKLMSGRAKALLPYKTPFVLGNDGSGVVEAVGPGVNGFGVGDEIFFRPGKSRIGTLAELALIREVDAARKPKNLSFNESASLPLTALTAWQAFFDMAQLQAGQDVLIHAGSGGVGVAAIQIAKHFGARVTTTCGPTGVELVCSLGADQVVNYREQDFSKLNQRFDIVFDTIGGETLKQCFQVLKPGGTVVSISAAMPTPDIARRYGKGWPLQFILHLANGSLRSLAKRAGGSYRYLLMEGNGEQLARIASLVEQGKLRPVIDSTFPLTQVNEALDLQRAGRAKGKIVVEISR